MGKASVLRPPEKRGNATQQPCPLSLPSEQRGVICVLGGRSGTSFIARLANILGVYLGPEQHMIAPSPVNESGFWEHREIVALNDEILARHGASWPSLVPLPQGWETDPSLDDLRERALNFIHREFAEAPLWGWKDPRACVTLPFWQSLMPRMRYILCFRNPVDTARSNAETLKAVVNRQRVGSAGADAGTTIPDQPGELGRVRAQHAGAHVRQSADGAAVRGCHGRHRQ